MNRPWYKSLFKNGDTPKKGHVEGESCERKDLHQRVSNLEQTITIDGDETWFQDMLKKAKNHQGEEAK